MITNIRYAGVMVDDLDEGLQIWRDLFDLEPVNEITTNQYGVRAQMLGVGGRPFVEVMTPADPETPIGRQMEERKNAKNPKGEGVYLIAIEVDDLEATLKHIESKGGTVIRSDGTASIAWVHPLSTKMVFIELSQAGFEGVPGTRIPS